MADKHAAHQRLIERLKSSADDVRRLCMDLDETAVAHRTVPDKWSVKEILAHMARVQEVFEQRLDAMLAAEGAPIVSYSPEADPEFPSIARKSAAELWTWYEDTRNRIVDKLGRLSPADWHRKGSHPEYPSYDVHFAMEYLAHHEAHHVYQMFQRRPSGTTPH